MSWDDAVRSMVLESSVWGPHSLHTAEVVGSNPTTPTLKWASGSRDIAPAGDLAGARMQYERALAIAEAARGPDHEDVTKWRSNLGLVLQDLGDLEGARVQVERALAIGEAALGPDHPTVAALRDNLSGVLQALTCG
jgi:hypothetical protein